jgi:hypothetical protein
VAYFQAAEKGGAMSDKTIVVFRIWKLKSCLGDCLALFPEVYEGGGMCMAYEHVGQHGGADYSECIRRTRPATPKEYSSLKRELEGAPFRYVLDVRKRRP